MCLRSALGTCGRGGFLSLVLHRRRSFVFASWMRTSGSQRGGEGKHRPPVRTVGRIMHPLALRVLMQLLLCLLAGRPACRAIGWLMFCVNSDVGGIVVGHVALVVSLILPSSLYTFALISLYRYALLQAGVSSDAENCLPADDCEKKRDRETEKD